VEQWSPGTVVRGPLCRGTTVPLGCTARAGGPLFHWAARRVVDPGIGKLLCFHKTKGAIFLHEGNTVLSHGILVCVCGL